MPSPSTLFFPLLRSLARQDISFVFRVEVILAVASAAAVAPTALLDFTGALVKA
jgi:hypothetical protein